jgi:hypothetical protein|tara:strand:+ start:2320 stop:2904 length:585 start_codon:yes stop_codon:yes gene_type:complete
MAKRGTLDDFKANVASDFARPNLFQVDLAFPSGIINNASLVELGKFTVRAANLPASQIGVIEVPFRGRVLKIAGDRTFEPWTITIQNDSKFTLRTAFELWASSVQAYNENFTSAAGLGDADDATGYFADMTVHQLARDIKDGEKPKILKSYRFYNVFPSAIAAIDLDFGNNDAIEEFTVELQTQYWTPISSVDS